MVGLKEWIVFPPGQERSLLSDGLDGSEFVNDVSSLIPGDKVYSDKLQTFEHKGKKVSFFRFKQEAQEVVFVPSGWYHQVINLKDTISINHNWFNASNLGQIILNLDKALEQVKNEIQDCKDDPHWSQMCQDLLKASFGMNHHFLQKLCIHLSSKTNKSPFDLKVMDQAMKQIQQTLS